MHETRMERDRLIGAVCGVRRRIIANQALWEGVLAASIALLGPAWFFLLGADLCPPPLLIVFALAGAGFALWRLWQRSPDLYRVSQTIDRRLGTADQIATAVHFLDAETPVAELQRRNSARLVRDLNPKTVYPLTLPRSLYGLAAVLLLILSAFALRYSLAKPLSFRQPLPKLILQSLLGSRVSQPEHPEPRRIQGSALHADPRLPGGGDPAGGEQMMPGSEPAGPEPGDSGTPESAEQGQASSDTDRSSNGADDDVDMGSEYRDSMDPYSQEGSSPEGTGKNDSPARDQKQADRQGKDANGSPNTGRADNSASSLVDRLKDAVNNLLSRLQQKPPAASPRQQASAPPLQKGAQGEGSGESRSGESEPEESGGQEKVNTDSHANDARAAKNSSGENGEKGSEQSDWNGPGQAEGNKNIAESRKLKAMGKLSDLYGQRSAQVTGAITVETQGGAQDLRSRESDHSGRHDVAGGESRRDEIPLAYQSYIKDYFNQLHHGSKHQSER